MNTASSIVPYLGGAIGLVSADFGEDVVPSLTLDDNDGLVFDMEGGVKYFVRPSWRSLQHSV